MIKKIFNGCDIMQNNKKKLYSGNTVKKKKKELKLKQSNRSFVVRGIHIK